MVLSRFLVLPLALLFAVSAFACIASTSSGVTPSDPVPVRIDRGDRQGENTYYFTPTADGTWSAVIENHGLRAIRVVVYEETGLLDRRVLSQRIDFAKYGAYPMGTAVSEPVDVLQGHTYKIVPRNAVGPKGGYALLYDDHATPTPAWPVMIDTAERVYSGIDLGVLGNNFYVLSYEYDHGPVWLYRRRWNHLVRAHTGLRHRPEIHGTGDVRVQGWRCGHHRCGERSGADQEELGWRHDLDLAHQPSGILLEVHGRRH